MPEIKTKVTKQSVSTFIKNVENIEHQKDSKQLLKMFKDATGYAPKLWGNSIIGYGSYHYESTKSTQKGDWPLTGFSPRKQNMTIYIMPGFKEYGDLLKKLGKYKHTGSCLYIKRLSEIDTKVLTTLIKRSVKEMKKRYS